MAATYDEKLKAFSQRFDTSYEDTAAQSRGAFLRAFPLNRLKSLKLDDYVMGKQTPTFCTYVEAKTKPWANILGATAIKFGIYFGKIKGDPTMKYRFHKRYGTKEQAFAAVKRNILDLIEAGRSRQFDVVDDDRDFTELQGQDPEPLFPRYLSQCVQPGPYRCVERRTRYSGRPPDQ
ncbi:MULTISPECIES: hypothetical protein [unclassified Bradyrhizobium]|uniref:hypothetical protein n=1 Tax=unclassified Bradyrhizobium TaxID=2631580 RepID=UPI0028F17300|nr:MULTISPECIES: hypothetical protein [unclassified Bradyrhizobium]